MVKADFKDMDLEQTRAWIEKIGIDGYRAGQIRHWLFRHQAASFDEMTTISKELRRYLDSHFFISRLKVVKIENSIDDSKKFLFELDDSNKIEAVLIPERDHYTLCISSQVGCAMGCKFCLTGKQGLIKNLRASEIINQIIQVRQYMERPEKLTNIVFMGMGEPLANFDRVRTAVKNIISQDGLGFSRRRVTLSTCGLVPKIEMFAIEMPINLAVSINASDNETRDYLMPINKKYPLHTLIEALRVFPLEKGRRITFEYVLIRDVNDSIKDASNLVNLLRGVRAKINLIPFNHYDGSPFYAPDDEIIGAFKDVLIEKNFTATIRRSKGGDISAACGQLMTAREFSSL